MVGRARQGCEKAMGLLMAKNSLVGNINKRKRLGISRPKSASTVSAKSFAAMKSGWKKSK
jgi:hypothetical protein